MEKDIDDALDSLGLSDKEKRVYIALLELGESPVNKITEISELNRVTVYPILKNLIKKGFVSKFLMERKTCFKAIPPKQILDLIKEKEDKIKSVLPILEEKAKKIKETTSIELFKGSKGISSFLEKIYSGEDKELWAYGNGKFIDDIIKYQSLNARNLRFRKKIKLNVIVNQVKADYLQDKRYKKLTKVKFNQRLEKINSYFIFGKRINRNINRK